MSKRIIFDCERMRYPYTGLYYFCKELGAALVKENEGHQNQIAFYVPEKEQNIFGSDQQYLIQNHLHKFFPKNLSDYDIWHCTYQGTNYLPSGKSNIKVITTIHDLNFLHQGKSGKKQEKYLLKLQRLINRSDAIVTISHFVKEQVLAYLEPGARNIEVIHNGRNKPRCHAFTKPASILTDRPFFFSIGTITEKKNFHVLPAMLLANDHCLIIAGITQNQAYHNKIMEEARRLGVEDRVFLIGAVTEEEKYWLFKNCAAFCFPSLAEGFGLPVIEAMQFGTPVILSKATSLPEIGGPHAIYYDSLETEGISATASDFLNKPVTPDLRRYIEAWAGQFQWEVAAERYLALYETI